MKNSQLIKTLKNFSEEEFNSFETYIISSSGNGRNLKTLMKNIKNNYPKFNNENFTKQNLYKSVFGNTKCYNDQVMRNMICRMNNLCRSFLLQKKLTENFEVSKALKKIISDFLANQNRESISGIKSSDNIKNIS